MFIIDRLEGDWALIEYGNKTFNIPASILPSEVKEGDVIEIFVNIKEDKIDSRKGKINSLMDDLFE